MKILILLTLLLSSCDVLDTPQKDIERIQEKIRQGHAATRKVVILNDHEYLESIDGLGNYSTYSFTHSGSCKNSSHICQK